MQRNAAAENCAMLCILCSLVCSRCCVCWGGPRMQNCQLLHLKLGRKGRPQRSFLVNLWKLNVDKGLKRKSGDGKKHKWTSCSQRAPFYQQAVSLCTLPWVILEGNRHASLLLFQFLSFEFLFSWSYYFLVFVCFYYFFLQGIHY